MNKKQIIQEFSQFISIPSVSADPKRAPCMTEAVDFLSKKLISLGFDVQLLQNGHDPATIFAKRNGSTEGKTIGIYGHYDVQPEDPVREWDSEPFVLTQKNGRFYGRGTADNKGHIIQNIAALEELVSTQSLKNTIVFLIEGEEETGSENFASYIETLKKELMKVDVFFITDVEMYKKNIPMIIYALRGLVYFELQVCVGERDMHSGVYGNAIPNPAQILCDLFAQMKDVRTGEVQIPGFYDDIRIIDDKERALLMKKAVSDDEFQKDAGAYSLTSLRNVPSYLAPKLFPSLDIHGISSGFTGEGPKTIIPAKAHAKFSCRLVENQDVKKMEKRVRKFVGEYFSARHHFFSRGPTTLIRKKISSPQIEIKTYSYDNPFYCSIDDPFLQKTAKILSEHFGHETVFMREGGSIPAAEIIQRVLKKPVVLTGFVLPDANLHAPNENFDEEMFFSGIEAMEKVYGI